MELNIPQLALTKMAQFERHKTVNTRSEHNSPRVEGSTPVRDNIFVEYILL